MQIPISRLATLQRRVAFVGLVSLALCGAMQSAHATDYRFPNKMPPGCSGSGGDYVCTTLTLVYNDTIAIGPPTPATVTINGNLAAQNGQINANRNAANLTLVVSGTLSVLYGANIGANVTAGAVSDPDGNVVFGGTLATTSGAIQLATGSSVAGSVSSGSGAITLAQDNNIGGDVTSSSGAINIGYQDVVGGSVSTSGTVTIGQSAQVAGAITGAGGGISIGYAAQVTGAITSSSGPITFARSSQASACVRSTASATITLGPAVSVNSVCCGSSTCSNSCVVNNSTGPAPGLCAAIAVPVLVAEYRFEEPAWTGAAGELKDTAAFAGGPYNGAAQGSPLPSPASAAPARAGNPGTCGYASLPGPVNGGGAFVVSGLPVSSSAGTQTTLAFWMYWSGVDSNIVVSWASYDLWLVSGWFGFNTTNSDVYGISSAGLANGWHHVVAVFSNGSFKNNKIYIDGSAQALAQRMGTPVLTKASVAGPLQIGGYGAGSTSFRFSGRVDELRVYTGALSASEVTALFVQTHACGTSPHHLELRHGSGTGVTCSPSTLTVMACSDASCATPYTAGVTGTLTASGAGMSVNWPTGASFVIASGSSSTSEDMQITTVGSVVLGTSSVSPVPASATLCNFGSPACTFTAADSGFVFSVPNHVADVLQTPVTVSAVRKSDSSAACVPAFASVSKSVTFTCAYQNPASGSLAVRVGGNALNAGNNAGSACDAGGRVVSLAFNATGVASTGVQYADVGQVRIDARYAGIAGSSEAGLVLTGTDSFIAAPYDFGVGAITAGNIKAGDSFAATVTARNYSGAVTPNFGRESVPEGATLSFVRTQPSGSGASDGAFSGALGSFIGGVASSANLRWSEVGRGDVAALLTSGNYLGSGQSAAGSSGGRSGVCSSEGGTCSLPTGATAFVAYGVNGWQSTRADVTGSISCTNANFGDPFYGMTKYCTYFVTGGAWPDQVGAAGRFLPHHFDVVVTPACDTFSYAAQPFSVKVSAMNSLATPGLTVNYDGSAATTPNFAQAVTLSDAPALGVGSFGSTGSVAAGAFSAGVATTLLPAYSFSSKLTAAKSLTVRAIDSDAVSSSGYAEGSTGLRSGRLRLSNAFGSEKIALPMAVQAQYWSGNAWVANGADSCTVVPASAIARSGYLDYRGTATTAWTTTASAVTMLSGNATLTLSAPSPSATGSVDIALNLGASVFDQSCLASHPTSSGAALPWLRAQQGSCSVAWDRDPAARASFGVYSPETRKTLHVREIF